MKDADYSAWRISFKAAFVPFLLSRLWVAFFVYWGHAQHAYLSPVPGGWEGVANWWLNPWTALDSEHFLGIAANGYNVRNAAFFPLYPAILKLAGTNPIAAAAWGIFVSNAAFLAALTVFYRMTEREYSPRIAQLAMWLLALCPTCVIFSAVYTESLFLLLLVSTFWCIRTEKWLWAAAFAFLASLTRNLGPIIFLALAAEWLVKSISSPARNKWMSLWPVLAPLAGFLAVQLYLQHETGTWLASIAAQQHFGRGSRHLNWPWLPLAHDIVLLFTPDGLNTLYLFSVLTCLLVFYLLIRHHKQQPLSYSLLLLGVILMHLCYTTGREGKTVDAMRYMSTAFPFTQLLAIEFQWIQVNRLRLILGLLIVLMISGAFCYSFGAKSYVS